MVQHKNQENVVYVNFDQRGQTTLKSHNECHYFCPKLQQVVKQTKKNICVFPVKETKTNNTAYLHESYITRYWYVEDRMWWGSGLHSRLSQQ